MIIKDRYSLLAATIIDQSLVRAVSCDGRVLFAGVDWGDGCSDTLFDLSARLLQYKHDPILYDFQDCLLIEPHEELHLHPLTRGPLYECNAPRASSSRQSHYSCCRSAWEGISAKRAFQLGGMHKRWRGGLQSPFELSISKRRRQRMIRLRLAPLALTTISLV